MDSRTYKLIELVGIWDESYSEATKNAIARAGGNPALVWDGLRLPNYAG